MRIIELSDLNIYDFGNRLSLSGMVLNDTKGNSYIMKLPKKKVKNISLLELDENDWTNILRQIDIQETEVLVNDGLGLKRAILRKSNRQIDNIISWNVYRRDKYKCRYCGANDIPLSVDHLVLWENGGPSIEENLLTSCKECNRIRGNMEYTDWINSDEYEILSENLSDWIKKANIKIIDTLDSIPVRVHQISRGSKKKKKNFHNTPVRHKSNITMKF